EPEAGPGPQETPGGQADAGEGSETEALPRQRDEVQGGERRPHRLASLAEDERERRRGARRSDDENRPEPMWTREESGHTQAEEKVRAQEDLEERDGQREDG